MYDVAIIGAGPAGAAAAIAAARLGASVLLLDRSEFPRDKACGDGIAPQALAVMAALGVSGLADGYPAVPALRLIGPSGDTAARPFQDSTSGVHTIPRKVFDQRMVAAAVAAGATLRHHLVRRLTERAGHVDIDGIGARVVIGADGASSMVRRYLGAPANPSGHLAIAIRGYAPMPADIPNEQRIVLTEQRWPAYAWSFPIGDGRRNIGYGELLRGGPVSRSHLLDRLAGLIPDADPAQTGELRAHHLPLSTHRPPPGRGRLLLAGDALSLINPFTGEGIYYAVLSGALAGAAAAAGDADPGRRYAEALRSRLGRHLRHTGVVARLAASPRLVTAGIRSAQRRQPVFDDLVELGLGGGLITARLLASIAAQLASSSIKEILRAFRASDTRTLR